MCANDNSMLHMKELNEKQKEVTMPANGGGLC